MYVVLYRFPMDIMHVSFFSGIRFTPHRLDQMSFLHLLLQHGMGIAQWINARMMRPSNHAINLALFCPQGKHVAILVGVGFLLLFSVQLPSYLFSSPRGLYPLGVSRKLCLSLLASHPCLYATLAYPNFLLGVASFLVLVQFVVKVNIRMNCHAAREP